MLPVSFFSGPEKTVSCLYFHVVHRWRVKVWQNEDHYMDRKQTADCIWCLIKQPQVKKNVLIIRIAWTGCHVMNFLITISITSSSHRLERHTNSWKRKEKSKKHTHKIHVIIWIPLSSSPEAIIQQTHTHLTRYSIDWEGINCTVVWLIFLVFLNLHFPIPSSHH